MPFLTLTACACVFSMSMCVYVSALPPLAFFSFPLYLEKVTQYCACVCVCVRVYSCRYNQYFYSVKVKVLSCSVSSNFLWHSQWPHIHWSRTFLLFRSKSARQQRSVCVWLTSVPMKVSVTKNCLWRLCKHLRALNFQNELFPHVVPDGSAARTQPDRL